MINSLLLGKTEQPLSEKVSSFLYTLPHCGVQESGVCVQYHAVHGKGDGWEKLFTSIETRNP